MSDQEKADLQSNVSVRIMPYFQIWFMLDNIIQSVLDLMWQSDVIRREFGFYYWLNDNLENKG